MARRILVQRRGRGVSKTFLAPSFRYVADVKYPAVQEGLLKGSVVDIVDDPGRTAPLALIKLENGKKTYMVASEGMKTGDRVEIGEGAGIKAGNVLCLKDIPEGSPVFNIEVVPGDGGKLVRSSGSYAIVLSRDVNKVTIQLPSRKTKDLHPKCRATIGIVAGGERTKKPFVKAGNKWHAMRARGKKYPITSAKAKNAADHKFGGKSFGVHKTVSRHAPPGRKVGSIAAKRTGRKKR